MPPNLSQVTKLLEAFLARPNANTVTTYRNMLADFARATKAKTIEAAITRLLSLGGAAANQRIEGYKRSVAGYRNAKGATVGRGHSSSAVNLRLTVLRSLIKQARRDELIDWDVKIPGASSGAFDQDSPKSNCPLCNAR